MKFVISYEYVCESILKLIKTIQMQTIKKKDEKGKDEEKEQNSNILMERVM